MPAESATLADCVAALCSTYRDGAMLLQQIKSKRKGLDISAQDLELSIARAEAIVGDQYDRTYRRCGEPFVHGDQVAIAALRDIIPHVEGEIIRNLKAHYSQNAVVDFAALQDVCDSSQNRAVLALMEQQQRLIAIGPIDNVIPPPLNLANAFPHTSTISPSRRASSLVDITRKSHEASSSSVHGPCKVTSSSFSPLTPPNTPFHPHPIPRPDSSLSRNSGGSTNTVRRNADPYKPMAVTVTKAGLFGIGKRTKVEPTINLPENPLVDEYLADALEGNAMKMSRTASSTSPSPATYELDHPAYNSWQECRPSSSASLLKPSESVFSFDSAPPILTIDHDVSTSNESIHSVNQEDTLPNEMNKYAGFCKGAWRQQTGDVKRAMEDRVRPGGMYNQAKYWQCKHCKFEGRLVPMDRKRNGYDMRVFKLVEGIQFRWEFMFKSHIASKDVESNPTKATFGCIFCCSEGEGTPTFNGIQCFMDHLVNHRKQLPKGEVLYRMNCLIGRQASMDEDFDINLTSMKGG